MRCKLLYSMGLQCCTRHSAAVSICFLYDTHLWSMLSLRAGTVLNEYHWLTDETRYSLNRCDSLAAERTNVSINVSMACRTVYRHKLTIEYSIGIQPVLPFQVPTITFRPSWCLTLLPLSTISMKFIPFIVLKHDYVIPKQIPWIMIHLNTLFPQRRHWYYAQSIIGYNSKNKHE